MLATSSSWSNGFKTLTFTIRNGAKWTDGKPFGAPDVVYTFNAMKSDKAIDLNALWSADGGPLTSVAAKGANQVVFTFKAASEPIFYFVADQTPIVPQHLWSSLDQSKLHSYADSHPVGTGPFTVSSCSRRMGSATWTRTRAARRRTAATAAIRIPGSRTTLGCRSARSRRP